MLAAVVLGAVVVGLGLLTVNLILLIILTGVFDGVRLVLFAVVVVVVVVVLEDGSALVTVRLVF